jgi:spore coat protein U-like protein
MRKTRSLLTTALIAAGLVLAASAATATDIPQSMQISATVQNSCTLFLNDFDFGPIDGLTGSVDSQTLNFSVTCNSGTAYSLAPDNGMNFGANANFATDRAMSDGAGHTIPYELWTDLGQTTAWDSTNPVTGTGTGDVQVVQPAVRIPALGGVPAGAYSDTLGVTLTYN